MTIQTAPHLTAHAFAIFHSGGSYTVRWRHNRRAIRQCRRVFTDGKTSLDLARFWIDLLVRYYNRELRVKGNGKPSKELDWLFQWADHTRDLPMIISYVGQEVM